MKTQMMKKPVKPLKQQVMPYVIAAGLLALYIWSFTGLELGGIKDTAWEFTKAIFSGLLHPDWGYVYLPDGEDLLRGLLDTLAIAVLGTLISAILCVPLAFWAAQSKGKPSWLSGSGKFVLSFIRTFPELVLAVMFIKAVGPGPFAGVLALGLHSIGMLGKLYSEAIENIDHGPVEALTASGANKLQILWYAIIPQVVPHFLSFTLYRFELSVRAASILGIIGAGGIGTPLVFALEARSWDRVGIILLGIIVTVTAIDLISGYLRKKLV